MKIRYIIILSLIILTGVYTKFLTHEEIEIAPKPLKEFPKKIGDWVYLKEYKFNDEIISILKLDDYLQRDFIKNDKKITLYIGYYKTHRKFAEIHTPKNCLVGGGWIIISEKRCKYNINGKKVNMIEALYEKDQQRELFYYWYKVNGNYIDNFFKYKLYIIKNSLLSRRSDVAFFRISIPIINNNIEEASKIIESFLNELIPIADNL